MQLLSEQEELEQLRLERRMANLQPVLATLERQAAYEHARLDVQAVVAAWEPLVAQKHAAYQGFLDALVALKQAYGVLLGVHRLQEQQVQALPAVVRERLNFPDVGSMQRNLASRMTDSMGWSMVLGPPEPLALPDLPQVMDVDPGTKELNPRKIQRFLDGR